MFKRIVAGALVLGAAAHAPPTAAQAQTAPRCAPRAEIASVLTERYGEHVQGAGRLAPEAVFEFWASEGGETWTVLVTSRNGTSCVLGAGQDWVYAPRHLSMGLAPAQE